MPRHLTIIMIAVASFLAAASSASAAAIIPGVFNSDTLPPNDDGSTGLVDIGFTVNFFGTEYTQLYVNNNGNVTFDEALSTFTPFGLLETDTVIIAPFFADIDTTSAGNPTTYGQGTFGGRDAFGVNWVNVDYFLSDPSHTNRNSLQLIMIERSDTGAGNFDFMYNYDLIQFEAGQASDSDAQGCGGASARVGYSNGVDAAFELAGSGVDGAFIDSGTCVSAPGPNALILDSLNSDVLGRYLFSVRNGQVVDNPTAVPEPTSMLLFGAGLLEIARRKRARKQ